MSADLKFQFTKKGPKIVSQKLTLFQVCTSDSENTSSIPNENVQMKSILKSRSQSISTSAKFSKSVSFSQATPSIYEFQVSNDEIEERKKIDIEIKKTTEYKECQYKSMIGFMNSL